MRHLLAGLPAVLHLLAGLPAVLHLLAGLPAVLHLLAGLPAVLHLLAGLPAVLHLLAGTMPAPCFRVVGIPQFSCGIRGTFYKVLGVSAWFGYRIVPSARTNSLE